MGKITLLEEIQEAAADNSMELSVLLRKCKLLAARINSKPAEDWVGWELDGYPNRAEVPGYRELRVQIKGNFLSIVRRVEGFPIPPALVEKYAGSDLERVSYRESVSTIEHLLMQAGNSGVLQMPMGNLVLLLNHKVLPDMECLGVWGEVGTAGMADILNRVRNRILNLSTELWKELPQAGTLGVSMRREEQQQASQIVTKEALTN